jgi:uncharacterized damage-inducible protein DinB
MPIPLITFFEGWGRYNDLLERAVSPLSQDQLDLRAADGMWSVRILASHIVSVRSWWFNEWMGEGGEELAGFADYDEGDESASRDAGTIAEALHTSWSCLEASPRSWNEDDLAKEFQRPARNAERGWPWRSRKYIVWHVAEHDVFHGGEISLVLGMHGLTGIDP